MTTVSHGILPSTEIVTLHRLLSRGRGAAADRGVTAPWRLRTGSSEPCSSLSFKPLSPKNNHRRRRRWGHRQDLPAPPALGSSLIRLSGASPMLLSVDLLMLFSLFGFSSCCLAYYCIHLARKSQQTVEQPSTLNSESSRRTVGENGSVPEPPAYNRASARRSRFVVRGCSLLRVARPLNHHHHHHHHHHHP